MRAILAGILLLAPHLAAAPKIDFNRDIRPILSDRCFACHGPDDGKRMANLRLDTREGAFAERKGYAIIKPGDATVSRLFGRISTEKAALRMPPAHSAATPPLSAEQVELIRRWIDEGAAWDTHWAYTPPDRHGLPQVKRESRVRNPIDSFVLARLEQEGLEPSPSADKATLLRRVSFDLTGLPPSPEELDAFLRDRSPGAYEKAVERLLLSPHYGERMAMQWLDLARYADTHGYHIDSHRDMWHWRDWLISVFNRNLPFDRFTIEQLAGDLLPEPTNEQLIATGFNRNHMINFEGGAIPEEYHAEYVADRVEATSTVWMGMTMGCARCHDHKYDPIRQKDFYSFFAFFNTIPEKGLDGRTGNAEPLLQLPSYGQKRRLDTVTRLLKEKEAAFPEKEVEAALAEWEKQRLDTLPAPPRDGLLAHYELDATLADTSGHYRHGREVRGDVVFGGGIVGGSASFSGETHATFPGAAPISEVKPFTIAIWNRAAGKPIEQVILHKVEDPASRRGFEFGQDEFIPLPELKRGVRFFFRLTHRWPESAISVRTRERFFSGDWHHVAIVYDGSGRAAGLQLYVNGKAREFEVLADGLNGPAGSAAPLETGNKEVASPYKGNLDDYRFYGRVLDPVEIEQLALHEPVRVAIYTGGKRSKEEQDRLRTYFLERDAPEHLRAAHAELLALRAEKKALDRDIPNTMVMAEMEKPRETFVLMRGDYRSHGEKVTPEVPAALPPLPAGAPRNRLGLAQWLVDPQHPLTARVAVNRYWEMYFGIGLVETTEDFGSQGAPPSHPELLDWLATEFVRTGWDIKAMQRLIVTSATYQQASRVTPALLERDPRNRLLARGPRFRLPAEMVRDNALAVSGLLNPVLGGPGVYPYQPPNVWEEIAYGDVFSAQTYSQSHGADLYRRSMYTFWKRTAPPPSMITFDAPDREKCTARRSRTNTPLQALVLLNDPTYVEAARALASRMIHEGGRDPGRRIGYAYRRALARAPHARETQVLRDLAERQQAEYRKSPELARDLLGVGASEADGNVRPEELAAWTVVASTILNLDEAVSKE